MASYSIQMSFGTPICRCCGQTVYYDLKDKEYVHPIIAPNATTAGIKAAMQQINDQEQDTRHRGEDDPFSLSELEIAIIAISEADSQRKRESPLRQIEVSGASSSSSSAPMPTIVEHPLLPHSEPGTSLPRTKGSGSDGLSQPPSHRSLSERIGRMFLSKSSTTRRDPPPAPPVTAASSSEPIRPQRNPPPRPPQQFTSAQHATQSSSSSSSASSSTSLPQLSNPPRSAARRNALAPTPTADDLMGIDNLTTDGFYLTSEEILPDGTQRKIFFPWSAFSEDPSSNA